jgi:hypothetical protein
MTSRSIENHLGLDTDGDRLPRCPRKASARVGSRSGRASCEGGVGVAESMRLHLVRMLDGVRLHRCLGLPTCALVFGARADLIHSTAAVRHPTFYRGEDYHGRTPSLLRTEPLRSFVTSVLAGELKRVSRAFVIPLGSVADEAVFHAEISPERRIAGFPHSSGAMAIARSSTASAATTSVKSWCAGLAERIGDASSH